ncbi:DUF3806 domain-containing protein [Pedococcus sp. 5OH_020]|uniref:DUF3806 domain-containing protein n=1 Tax=Pedococcus sp. 5OH_020 TaxID=2989814 RepID=UPI0022E9EF44|nr:DUF3806 domain-containing protein [Pedococcus sp. 5OH_020]
MAWFGRRRDDAPHEEPFEAEEVRLPDAGDTLDDGAALRPLVQPLGDQERTRIAQALTDLQAEGVDVDDLEALGSALDRAYSAWRDAPDGTRPDHAAIVERYAVGIGEYLERHTDLDWQVVTDVFGTDLSLTEGFKGSFVVVPHNLVAGRWMRGETGWVPAVVGHIVRRRNR